MDKPLWGDTPPKKYRIRKAAQGNKVFESGLSSTALVNTNKDLFSVPIAFDPSLVDFLGKHMLYGISNLTPAYICATKVPKGGWQVWVRYFGHHNSKTDILLWVSDVKPKFVKGLNNGNQSTEKEENHQTEPTKYGECLRCYSKCAGGLGRTAEECGGLFGDVAQRIRNVSDRMSRDGDYTSIPGAD